MTNRQRQHLKKTFLAAFAKTGVVSTAAQAAGVDRTVIYDWKNVDPNFAAAYEVAEMESTERLETEAIRRAHDGTKREVSHYYQGDKVGVDVITEYSDTLLIFLLKARKPLVYGTKVDVTSKGEPFKAYFNVDTDKV